MATEEYRLVVRMPNAQPRELWLNQPEATVGRDAACDIVLPTSFVSRRHARLRRSAEGLAIIDEGSTNGTLVNGERVDGTRLLADGDRVVMGDVVMEVRSGDSESGAATSLLGTQASSPVVCDTGTWDVWIQGERLDPRLSRREFELLSLLTAAPGTVLTREELGSAVWGTGNFDYNMLNQLLHRLRRKIGAGRGIVIDSVPGVGYRIRYE